MAAASFGSSSRRSRAAAAASASPRGTSSPSMSWRTIPGLPPTAVTTTGRPDAMASRSVSEAASLTLLEAMASGLPVVVTAVGGNPGIVRQDIDGLLVPRGDADAAAAALLRLLDDPNEAAAMGAAGRARVEERYQLQQTV